MIAHECPHEQDVLDALDARRWPARCDAATRAHVAACRVCADLVEVASALRTDHGRWWQQANPPPASLVWWRAQMRARAEAAQAASRPVLVAQVVFGLLTTALAAAALALTLDPVGGAWAGTLDERWRALAAAPVVAREIVPVIPPAVWLAVGLWLLVVPAAIYAALRE